MDHKTWIYLLLLAGYYVFKFIRDRQKALKASVVPAPILKKQSETVSNTIPNTLHEEAERKRKEMDKVMENLMAEKKKVSEKVLSYEDPETQQQVFSNATNFNSTREGEVKPETNSGILAVKELAEVKNSSYRDYFKNPQDLKNAFILSEILNRRY